MPNGLMFCEVPISPSGQGHSKASKYRLSYSAMARIIGRNHCMMFGFAFTFNRADEDEMERARKALDEAAEFALEEGGVPWKPAVEEQKMTLDRMDPNTAKLLKGIKRFLDPNGIMNPGNWEGDRDRL